MFDKIITITLNPAFDVTNWMDTCSFKEPNIVKKETITASGKGINVSKTLLSVGIINKAICVLGNDNKDKFIKLLNQDGIEFSFSSVLGQIRENITLCFPNDTIMKINRKGIQITSVILNEIIDKIKDLYNYCDNVLLVFSGSTPVNMDKGAYRNFILKFKQDNVKIAIDSSQLTLEDYLAINPYIIKPNFEEMQTIMGSFIKNEHALVKAIESIWNNVSHIVVSLGEKGIIYANKGNVLKVNIPKVNVISTVGAGDNLLAGFIYGLQNNFEIIDCLKYAAAFGTASVLLEGTSAVKINEVTPILNDIEVIKI